MPSRYQGQPEEVEALSAYINLARAYSSLTARIHKHLASTGLTASQFAILEALLHCGPALQKDLCGKLLTSSGNVTFVIDGLEQRGLVRRERQQDDRRCVRVELTPEGKRVVSKLFPLHARIVAEEMAVLSSEEQQLLRSLCRTLGKGERAGGGGDCCGG